MYQENLLTLQKAQEKLPGQTVDQKGNYPAEVTRKKVHFTSKDSYIAIYFDFVSNTSSLLTLYEKFSKM